MSARRGDRATLKGVVRKINIHYMKKIILPILILIGFSVQAQTMTDSLKKLNTNEASDRIAIRELIDNYGYYAGLVLWHPLSAAIFCSSPAIFPGR
jgi:hypothetical protein